MTPGGPRLALMQPYFFPYVGYFSLIAAVDTFVLFDTAQYIRRGWCNRNRILKEGGGWQYVTVPVARHDRDTAIRDVRVSEHEDWRTDLRQRLRVYRKAPFYGPVLELIEEVIAPRDPSIGELAVRSIRAVCSAVSLTSTLCPFPDDLDVSTVHAPGEWGRAVALRAGSKAYLNAPGGREIYDPSQYEPFGLDLGFVDPQLAAYPQHGGPFEPALSVIDLLMFLPPAEVRAQIDSYTVEWVTAARTDERRSA